MKVLIACEFSGIVRDAFAKRGHDAWSCDLLPTEIPGNHIQGDVRDILGNHWDLMIAHPPCTHLACSGASWFYKKEQLQKDALIFVSQLMLARIEKICIENPVGIISTKIRKPNQIIQPYDFGDPFQKTTCLWLKNLPKLIPTCWEAPLFGMHLEKGEFINFPNGGRMAKWYVTLRADKNRSQIRSKTFPGIANAMAEQWGKEEFTP